MACACIVALFVSGSFPYSQIYLSMDTPRFRNSAFIAVQHLTVRPIKKS